MSSPTAKTPAIRFLDRGQQLVRLQSRITTHMLNQAESEKDNPVSLESASDDMSRIATRVGDVGLALQLFLARHVDNFQTFLDETLRAVFTTQPDLLKSSETAKVCDVLSHESIESFRSALIEKKVHGLGYKAFGDLCDAVKKELKFDLFRDQKMQAQVELLFDIRNLITHNSGVVNQIFMSRHPELDLTIGQPYPLALQQLAEFWDSLIKASGDIEQRAKKKFKLYGHGA